MHLKNLFLWTVDRDKTKENTMSETRYDKDERLKFYPERIYVADRVGYSYAYCTAISQAFADLDQAVPPVDHPVEIGIYQLVRVAKFEKKAVETVTIKELEKHGPTD